MKTSVLFAGLLLLAACGREAAIPSSEENAQMDDAANLLDQAPADLDKIDDGGLNAVEANQL
ncbi:MAG: hypothetical protein HOQ41_12555 [Ensifer adhaerens]|nr:hypothetical protein [Ensifer adhaerens]